MGANVELTRSVVFQYLLTEDKSLAETYRKKYNVVSACCSKRLATRVRVVYLFLYS